jgi:hypothetical protein
LRSALAEAMRVDAKRLAVETRFMTEPAMVLLVAVQLDDKPLKPDRAEHVRRLLASLEEPLGFEPRLDEAVNDAVLWREVVKLEPRLGQITVPRIRGESFTVHHIAMGGRVLELGEETPVREVRGRKTLELRPGAEPRGGVKYFARGQGKTLSEMAAELVPLFLQALEGFPFEKATHLGVRVAERETVCEVAWQAAWLGGA